MMNRNRFVKTMCLLVLAVLSLSLGANQAFARTIKASVDPKIKDRDPNSVRARQKRRVTNEQRKKAAANAAAKRPAGKKGPTRIGPITSSAIVAPPASAPMPLAGTKPDYLGGVTPNWAYTPVLRKFVDMLPGLGSANANNLGQYLTVAVPDTITYPGSDYYEIELRRFTEKMHSDLPPTMLQGYVQINNGTDAGGNNTVTPPPIHYLGPAIVAQKDRPVRIKFINKLPTGMGGDLFIPVDTTGMGAGMGPYMAMAMMADRVGGAGATVEIQTMAPHNLRAGERIMLHGFAPAAYNGMFAVLATGLTATSFQVTLKADPGGPATTLGHIMENFSQNRATLHLHGGRTPWISDGTPHQWTTPANEITQYPRGVSVSNVPDMPDPGDGSLTFFYSNQQTARLMFYHDHAWGITRLNVYTGEAAPYLVVDQAEKDLIAAGLLPAGQIPLVIQDKTFVDAGTLPITDPTWNWGSQPGLAVTGDLWYPHVYMVNQNPNELDGVNPMGRWDYGPWFWPPWPVADAHKPIMHPDGTWGDPCLPDVSMTMEAFHDTPLVNGTAYPVLNVKPQTYRFRILNAANDRFWNLQLHQATPLAIAVTNGGSGYSTTPTVTIDAPPAGGIQATARAEVSNGVIVSIWITNPGTGYTTAPAVTITDGTGSGATAVTGIGLDDVKMVPAVLGNWPPNWPAPDNRDGGLPDPAMRGPSIIQIGTEGGFLPAPVVWDNIPIGWDRDPKSMTVGNVLEHNLFLGCAERADILIDFSAFRGKTLILYNDAPAAVPARDSRLDYYTGNEDLTAVGGHGTTLPGYGPNIRTIMQIKVADEAPAPAYDLAALQAAFASSAATQGVFAKSQDPILVPQAGYNSAYNAAFPAGTTAYERLMSNSLAFRPMDLTQADKLNPASLTINNTPKAIAEEFESEWGRMSGFLGVELPFTNGWNQTTIFYGYVDPAATSINDNVTTGVPTGADGTQIWKITHNGVDTHPVHFHLFDVQLINRVDWGGVVKPPEPYELGWKETVRMNPLEDCIVALRPVAPKQPFGLPDSIRPLNPMMPLHDATGFTNVDPATGNPIVPPVTNELTNFGWEYVWHCHILSHEEMDMMRPVVFNVARNVPAAPVVTALGGSTAVLSWTDATLPTPVYPLASNSWGNPAGEVGFRIERAVGSGAFATLATAIANATTYTDATILPSTQYSYRVVAYNAAGEATSNVVSVGILPPGPPQNVSVVVGSGQATVTFSAPASDGGSPITSYSVASSPDAVHPAGIVVTSATVLPITIPGLTNGTPYTFTVMATNAAGTGPGVTVGPVTPGTTVPSAPSSLLAYPSTAGVSPITVTLIWVDTATNEDGFVITRRTGAGTFVEVARVGANVQTWVDTAVTPSTIYYYYVRAFNAAGESAPAGRSAVTPSDAPPPAPSSVTISVTQRTYLTIAWNGTAVANETGFQVQRSAAAAGPWTTIATVGRNVSSYSNSGLTPGTTYYYQVRSVNDWGTSAWVPVPPVSGTTLP